MKNQSEQKTTKETKHTPGPWKSAGESIITASDTNCIAVIESDGGYEAPPEQREANAHLIAAAPDMLAALEKAHIDIYEAINGRHNLSLVWHDLQAAIVAAKGEKS